MSDLDPSKLVFIDESGFDTRMTRRCGRAPMLIEGAMDGDAFCAWVEQMLAPTLQRHRFRPDCLQPEGMCALSPARRICFNLIGNNSKAVGMRAAMRRAAAEGGAAPRPCGLPPGIFPARRRSMRLFFLAKIPWGSGGEAPGGSPRRKPGRNRSTVQDTPRAGATGTLSINRTPSRCAAASRRAGSVSAASGARPAAERNSRYSTDA